MAFIIPCRRVTELLIVIQQIPSPRHRPVASAVRRHVFLLSVCLPLFPPPVADGQIDRTRFQHIRMEDGLSQDIVRTIAQDHLGFMWFGTEDGLNVYDGYGITVFKHDDRDTNSIAGSGISSIIADHRRRLVIVTSGGLNVLDPETRTFRRLTIPSAGSSRTPPIISLCDVPGEGVLVLSVRGLYLLTGDTVSELHRVGPSTSSVPLALHRDREGIVWLADSTGVTPYFLAGDRLTIRPDLPVLPVPRGVQIVALHRDRQGELWACTYRGLFRWDASLRRVRRYVHRTTDPESLADDLVVSAAEDSAGRMWFGTFSSLERFEPAFDGFEHFRPDARSGGSLFGDRVYALCTDRTGILWIGTYRGGVNILDPARQRFSRLTVRLKQEDASQDVYALCRGSDGSMWLGGGEGLFRLNGVRPYDHGGVVEVEPQAAVAGQTVLCLARRRNGEIWAGTEGAVYRLHPGTMSFVRHRLPVQDAVRALFEDRRGMCWIGTEKRGLYVFDDRRNTFTRWRVPDVHADSIDGGVWAIAEDRTGRLWFGTWGYPYLLEYDPARNLVVRHGTGEPSGKSLRNAAVRSIREDRHGILWLATWGGGLARFDPAARAFRHLTESDGLPNNYLKALEIDDRERIWASTERGLSRYDPRTGLFRNYTAADGLQSDFFWTGSSFRDSIGLMCFGARGGATVFHPDSVPENRTLPAVVITSFKVFGGPVPLPGPSVAGRTVTIRYEQDFFSVEFVGLNYTSPERTVYAYRLEGFDENWTEAGTRRYAAYTHLDPGTYTFRVKAANSDGYWNDEGAQVGIVILPPLYMTWWFRLPAVALVVAAIYGAYRYRLRRLLEVEHLRQRIARDLHDDIGTNLSAIVLTSQMANQSTLAAAVREQLEEIRTVALTAQEHMADIVWMLNPKNDSPEQLVARMKAEAARLLKNIPSTIRIEEGALPGAIGLTLKRNLFLIYKEALHNIAKHAEATSVAVDLSVQGRTVVLRVRDDGRGFDTISTRRGNGLDNMQARASQIGGTLEVGSSPGAGTEVRLTVRIA